MVNLVKLAEFVPADVKALVEKATAGLKDGTVAPFVGPVTDNTGKVQLAKGTPADDKWLGGINFYVKGVEGKVPVSK
jgi:simple sugar transport system substrate-binding protein